jgi:hypothetical protein
MMPKPLLPNLKAEHIFALNASYVVWVGRANSEKQAAASGKPLPVIDILTSSVSSTGPDLLDQKNTRASKEQLSSALKQNLYY